MKSLKAIVLLDMDGKRILAKYYDEAAINPIAFEKKLFKNTRGQKISEEFISLDRMYIIHKFFTDFHFYVIGQRTENPMLLDSISDCFVDVMKMLTTKATLEQSFIDGYRAQLILALDEICDNNGLILETDPNLVYSRITLKPDVVEQSTMVQKLQNASELIKFPWSRS